MTALTPARVARTALALALAASVAITIQAQTLAALAGTYTGTYRCGQGVTAMTLSLVVTASGELTGRFTFYLPAGTHNQAYTYSLYGNYNPPTAKFSLMPVRWETAPPPNFAMVGLNGSFESDELSGTITGAGCSTFNVERDRGATASTPSRSVSSGPTAARAASPATAQAQSGAKSQAAATPQAGVKPRGATRQAAPKSPAGPPQPAANPDGKTRDANIADIEKALDDINRIDQQATNPVLDWMQQSKKDGLTGDVTTRVFAMTELPRRRGDVTATASCNDSGVWFTIKLDSYTSFATPSFVYYADPDNPDGPVVDVRMRIDDGRVHVAKAFLDKKGDQFYDNSMAFLFYEPGLVAKATRAQQDAVTTGILPFDRFLAPIARQAAEANAQDAAASSAGQLGDLLQARSIRVELAIKGADDDLPILDLNPQNKVLHNFVTTCNARFTPRSQQAPSSQPAATPARPATGATKR